MPCEIQSVRSQIKEPVLPRAQQFQESGTWVMHINSTLQKQTAATFTNGSIIDLL